MSANEKNFSDVLADHLETLKKSLEWHSESQKKLKKEIKFYEKMLVIEQAKTQPGLFGEPTNANQARCDNERPETPDAGGADNSKPDMGKPRSRAGSNKRP